MNEIITKEAIQELQKSLTPVVEKLGKGGEWVYSVYYKQQIVVGIQSILFVILTCIGWYIVYRMFKKARWDYGPDNFFAIASVIGSVLMCIATIASLFIFFDGVGRLINPDYYILHDLLSIIKKS